METIDRLWQLLYNPVILSKILSGEVSINWEGIEHTQIDKERVEGYLWYKSTPAPHLEELINNIKRREKNNG